MRQFAVIGLGRFGMTVAEALSEKGAPVLAVDAKPEPIEEVMDTVAQAMQMDSTDRDALKSSGVLDVDVVVVSIGENMEASILTTALLKQLGAKTIVARATTRLHGEILKLVGADKVVYPEYDEGLRLANSIFLPSIVDRVDFPGGLTVADIKPPKRFLGKTLKELDLRAKYSINVLFVRRPGQAADTGSEAAPEDESRFIPKPGYKIENGDVLVVIGDSADIEALHDK